MEGHSVCYAEAESGESYRDDDLGPVASQFTPRFLRESMYSMYTCSTGDQVGSPDVYYAEEPAPASSYVDMVCRLLCKEHSLELNDVQDWSGGRNPSSTGSSEASGEHDDSGSNRGWNTEFRRAFSLPQAKDRVFALYGAYRDFEQTAFEYGKIILNEVGLPKKEIEPVDVGGIAGGAKYIAQGIFFKLASDVQFPSGRWMYGGHKESEARAMKASSHELKSLKLLLDTSGFVQGGLEAAKISVPMCCTIDHRGFRLLCFSLLPIGEKTQVYGSSDGGLSVLASDTVFNNHMKEMLGDALGLKPHKVGRSSPKEIYGPGDLEGHRGLDGVYYAPSTENIGGLFCNLLRPELVRSSLTPLSSDAFSGWGQADVNAPLHNKEVLEATKRMLTEGAERAAADLAKALEPWLVQTSQWIGKTRDGGIVENFQSQMQPPQLSPILHRHGVNVRHWGRVRVYLPSSELQQAALLEMTTIVLKNELRLKQRQLCRAQPSRSDKAIVQLCAAFLNKVHGAPLDPDIRPLGVGSFGVSAFLSAQKWMEDLARMLHLKFHTPFPLPAEDMRQLMSVDRSILMVRVAQRTGVVLDPTFLRSLQKVQPTPQVLLPGDIVGLTPRMKTMGQVSICEAQVKRRVGHELLPYFPEKALSLFERSCELLEAQVRDYGGLVPAQDGEEQLRYCQGDDSRPLLTCKLVQLLLKTLLDKLTVQWAMPGDITWAFSSRTPQFLCIAGGYKELLEGKCPMLGLKEQARLHFDYALFLSSVCGPHIDAGQHFREALHLSPGSILRSARSRLLIKPEIRRHAFSLLRRVCLLQALLDWRDASTGVHEIQHRVTLDTVVTGEEARVAYDALDDRYILKELILGLLDLRITMAASGGAGSYFKGEGSAVPLYIAVATRLAPLLERAATLSAALVQDIFCSRHGTASQPWNLWNLRPELTLNPELYYFAGSKRPYDETSAVSMPVAAEYACAVLQPLAEAVRDLDLSTLLPGQTENGISECAWELLRRFSALTSLTLSVEFLDGVDGGASILCSHLPETVEEISIIGYGKFSDGLKPLTNMRCLTALKLGRASTDPAHLALDTPFPCLRRLEIPLPHFFRPNVPAAVSWSTLLLLLIDVLIIFTIGGALSNVLSLCAETLVHLELVFNHPLEIDICSAIASCKYLEVLKLPPLTSEGLAMLCAACSSLKRLTVPLLDGGVSAALPAFPSQLLSLSLSSKASAPRSAPISGALWSGVCGLPLTTLILNGLPALDAEFVVVVHSMAATLVNIHVGSLATLSDSSFAQVLEVDSCPKLTPQAFNDLALSLSDSSKGSLHTLHVNAGGSTARMRHLRLGMLQEAVSGVPALLGVCRNLRAADLAGAMPNAFIPTESYPHTLEGLVFPRNATAGHVAALLDRCKNLRRISIFESASSDATLLRISQSRIRTLVVQGSRVGMLCTSRHLREVVLGCRHLQTTYAGAWTLRALELQTKAKFITDMDAEPSEIVPRITR